MAASGATKISRSSLILFPGQGSQHIGMASNLCNRAKSLFDMANEVLGYNLLKLCQEGPEQDLDRTVHSQPAVFVTSLAALENLRERSSGAVEKCIGVAGFSVGEFAALVMSQSIDFLDALKLIKKRAELTQTLSDQVPSGMMTTIYGSDGHVGQACTLAQEFCSRSGLDRDISVCAISNYLFPHAKVVGGHQMALEFIERNKRDFGIKKTKRLAVSGAFHTHLMKPAREELARMVSQMRIRRPEVPVYSNLTGQVFQDAQEVRESIPRHVYKPVKWEQIMHSMYQNKGYDEENFPVTFECGPKNDMITILGMINKTAQRFAYDITCSPEIHEKDDRKDDTKDMG